MVCGSASCTPFGTSNEMQVHYPSVVSRPMPPVTTGRQVVWPIGHALVLTACVCINTCMAPQLPVYVLARVLENFCDKLCVCIIHM